jgi:hypothetical protein
MKASNRYTWFVGIVALAIVVYITVNTLRTSGHGSRGLQPGTHLPAFAAPLPSGSYPNHALADVGNGKVPPCQFKDPGVLNICRLWKRPLVLAFTVLGHGSCEKELDTMQRVMPRFPQVAFTAVAIGASKDDLAKHVREHGWTFPVAYDHGPGVANLYDVVICPSVTFAYAGGTVMKTTLGTETTKPSVLAADIRALLRTKP